MFFLSAAVTHCLTTAKSRTVLPTSSWCKWNGFVTAQPNQLHIWNLILKAGVPTCTKKEVNHRWRRWKMKTDLFWEDSDWSKVRRHPGQHQYPRKIRFRFIIYSYVKIGVATDITVWRWLAVNWETVQKSVSAQICNSNKWTEKNKTKTCSMEKAAHVFTTSWNNYIFNE